MREMKRVSTAIACATLLCAAHPAMAQDEPVWTSAWQGVWNGQHEGDCGSVLTSSTEVCAGQQAAPQILGAQGFVFDGLPLWTDGWSGTVTDTSLALLHYVEQWGLCLWHPDSWERFEILGSRNGDAAIITTTWSFGVNESCPPGCGPGCDGPASANLSGSCQTVTTLVRSTTVAACSTVPARASSWGKLKVRYR